ncbi:unnamed protein product [Durusdinium trenchii]|uniref:Uncharacterized protein n=1 Tax=Durusdinium trenchii TaxID=1381693 RepID=A0ABP0PQR8_9DINO
MCIFLGMVPLANPRNQRLVEQLLDDLPDDSCDRTALVSENRSEVCTPPARPVAEFRSLGNSLATVSRAYGTLQSVFAHLMRDWSGISEQTVISNQYGQLLEEVKPHLPRGSHVLVPGAGLGRLALMLAGEGFQEPGPTGNAVLSTGPCLLGELGPGAAIHRTHRAQRVSTQRGELQRSRGGVPSAGGGGPGRFSQNLPDWWAWLQTIRCGGHLLLY